MLVGLRSRRQIAPFALHHPATIDEAITLRRTPGTNAFLAGGTDLIDWLKHGHRIDRLIRLDGIPALSAITGGPDHLHIGATATHAAIIDSTLLQTQLPDLPRLWRQVANPRVRFTGTIGGNVMANRPDYDAPPALLALGAETHGSDGLLTGFTIPSPSDLRLFADRSLRPAICIWLGLNVTDGQVTRLRVGVGMAHPAAVGVTLTARIPAAALGAQAAALAEEVTRQLPEPITDGRASAAYRRRMAGVLVRRMLSRAGERA
jgi:carbon-monoxide dehydrogenase medium subunit